jgi:TonB family protein
MKKVLLLVSASFLNIFSIGQTLEKEYLDISMRQCEKSTAYYVHTIDWDDESKQSCNDTIYRLDGTIKYLGGYVNYKKKKARGQVQNFYNSGKVSSEEKYSSKGKPLFKKRFFENGQISYVRNYQSDGINFKTLDYYKDKKKDVSVKVNYFAKTKVKGNQLIESRFKPADSMLHEKNIFTILPQYELKITNKKFFYDNGNLHYEEFYKEKINEKMWGKQLDSLLSYHENGKLKRKEYYSEEMKDNNACYLTNGEPTEFKPFFTESTYPGGENEMLNYLGENIKYPKKALGQNIQGTVYVEFIVCKDGEICEFNVVKGVEKEMDAEVVRVLKKMPKWIPAKSDGKPRRSYFTLPVQFALE